MAETSASPPRLPALDVARGIAVLLMIWEHFVPTESSGSRWSMIAADVAAILYGKGAPLFCLLLGVGLVLWRDRHEADPTPGYALRRALALVALGWVFGATLWPTEILMPLGLMTLLCAPLLSWPAWRLWSLVAALTVAAPLLGATLADYAVADWTWEGRHLAESGWGWVDVRYFTFDGNYPLVPWLALPVLGVLLGRVGAKAAAVPRRLFFILLPAAIALQLYAGWAEKHSEQLGSLAAHLISAWTPTTIPFLLLATVSSAAVVCGLLWWQAARPGSGRRRSIVADLGRTSLTHYLLHIVAVYVPLRRVFPEEDWSVGVGVAAFGGYVAVATPLTIWWLRHHRRGPLEALLARLSGSR
jgi:uncharacterized membrane protein YeiB